MKQLLGPLADVTTYFWRVYSRGWNMIFRTAIAYLIISLFMWPLDGVASLLGKISTPYDDTLAGIGVRLILVGLMFLALLPPTFYVAASWVGFCRRINDSDYEHLCRQNQNTAVDAQGDYHRNIER